MAQYDNNNFNNDYQNINNGNVNNGNVNNGNMNYANFNENVHPYMPQKRSGSTVKILLAVILALLLVVGVTVGVVVAKYITSPQRRIVKGFQNLEREIKEVRCPLYEKLDTNTIAKMLNEEGGHVKTKLDVSSDILTSLVDMTLTLGVDADIYKDMQNKELNAKTSFSVMNVNLADMEIFADEDVVCFTIPDLYLENIYVNTENVVSQYNNSRWVREGMEDYADQEDFSINLFDEKYLNRTNEEYMEEYADEFTDLKKKMVIEKVQSGIYRVLLPQEQTESLVKEIIRDSEKSEPAQSKKIYDIYKKVICSDISVLLEINKENRIQSIWLEEPVKLLDKKYKTEMEVFLAGEVRSVDKVQGKIVITDDKDEEVSIIMQYLPALDGDDYTSQMDIKCKSEDETIRVRINTEYDNAEDDFSISMDVKDSEDHMVISTNGYFRHIVPGEGFDLKIDKASIEWDDTEMFYVSGNISVEPLEEPQKSFAKPDKYLFDMTEEELEEAFTKAMQKYDSWGLFD